MSGRVAFNHHREGDGEPLVLIHGVGHHWQGWAPVIRQLRGEFDIIAVDSPGFGRSQPLPAAVPPNISAYADAYAAWFAEQGIERPHVCGNSMGGGIALELARRGLVRSAHANSPVGFWSEGERKYTRTLLKTFALIPRGAQPLMLKALASPHVRQALFGSVFARGRNYPTEAAQHMMRDLWGAEVMPAVLDAFADYNFADGHELAGTPVTVSWGTRDRLLIHFRQAPRARKALPNATHVSLKGLGHTPFYDDPGMLAAVIRRAAGR